VLSEDRCEIGAAEGQVAAGLCGECPDLFGVDFA
jgi:hypothetical protein